MMPNTLEPHCLKLVMVKKDFLWKKRKGGKLDPKWVGPYIITAKFSKGFYSLQFVANSSDCIKRVNGAHLNVYLHPNCEQVCTLYSITYSLCYTTKEDQIRSCFIYNIPNGGFNIWL